MKHLKKRRFRVRLFASCAAACLALTAPNATGQSAWVDLPDAPYTGRHNDVYFVNPDDGWVVNGDGEIWHTSDGGDSWARQFQKASAHFRTVAFLSADRGFAGNVGDGEFGATDRSAIYETSDGGASWQAVATFHGRTPTGICGMNVVNDSTVVAVGRVRGPAFFAKTTNNGVTWKSLSMSTYAAGLIDTHFFSPDSGFAVGLTSEDHEQSRGIILFTEDGGDTWEQRFVSSRTGEWAWKITFPTRNVGYVSLQRNSQTPIFFLKTTDGGETWQEMLFSSSYYFVQGIGFATENLGWIGGNSSFPTFVTSDGGQTWSSAEFGVRVNRLRFLSDSLGYAAGRSVYKYDLRTPTGTEETLTIPGDGGLQLDRVFPNPSRGSVTVRYTLAAPSEVRVDVVDVLGRRIRSLQSGRRAAGTHEVKWDRKSNNGSAVASGVYLFSVETARSHASVSVVLDG